jgi:hypothetical protein
MMTSAGEELERHVHAASGPELDPGDVAVRGVADLITGPDSGEELAQSDHLEDELGQDGHVECAPEMTPWPGTGGEVAEAATVPKAPGPSVPAPGPDAGGAEDGPQVAAGEVAAATRRPPLHAGSSGCIPIDAIAISADRRPVSPTWLPRMMDSIEDEGLYIPITVRLAGGGDKPYELVAGRHRLEACRSLGRAEIEARVVDLDDEMAEMAKIAENLFRSPLKPQQLERSLARWEALYQARYPETVQHRAGGVARAWKRKAARSAEQGEAAGAGQRAGKRRPSFAQHVANRFGVSKRTAERALKRSRMFGDEEREIFEQFGVTSMQQDALAAVADPERRAACLEAIVSGLDPAAAIARCQAGPGDEDEAAMTDQEWLEVVCGEVRGRLKDTTAYDVDAVLYREIEEARREFRAAVQAHLVRIGPGGPLIYLVWRICNLVHPKDWRVCEACGGAGAAPDGSRCQKCSYPGVGYRPVYENGR